MSDTLTLSRQGSRSAQEASSESLRDRAAGLTVIRRCLELQTAAPRRGAIARAFGAEPLHPDAVAWFGGGLGELELAQVLESLGPDWTVMHSVPGGRRGREIDHLLIGPAGVITLRVQYFDGKRVVVSDGAVSVGGRRLKLMRASLEEREDVAARLSVALGAPVEVSTFIVVVGAERIAVRSRSDIQLITPAELQRLIERAGRVQSPERVRVLSAIAERRQTWQEEAVAPIESAEVVDRFAELQQTVRRARIRREVWSITGLLAALAASWTALLVMAPASFAQFAALFSG